MFKSLIFALTLLAPASCIGGGNDPEPGECARDEDCAKFSNACNTSVCRTNSCTSQPVVCNDDNVCTNNRCDAALGCVFDPVEAGEPCAIGASGACDGLTWYPPDTCDRDGQCVDTAAVSCDGSTGNACKRSACSATNGCTVVNETNGADCVAGGRSDTCVDGEIYFADFCDGGTCAEAGKERCPDSFCERGRCNGDECGTIDIGLGIDLTGTWNAIGLFESGTLVTTRVGIILTDDGAVEIRGQVASANAEVPTGGAYCVGTDRTLQLGLDFEARRRTFSGRVSPGRDIAFLTPDDGTGVMVLVRDREMSEARLAGGTYRVLGFDTVVQAGLPVFDAIHGDIEFKSHCIASGSYRLGNTGVDLPITITEPPSCLRFDGANAVGLDVRTPGDVHVLAGVVGTGGHYLVMQRYRVGDRVLEPSLIVLVRTGLSTSEAFAGEYAFTRVDAGVQIATTVGALTLDGEGGISAFVEGSQGLAPGTPGTLEMLAESEYVASVALDGVTYERTGQVGQTTFDRVDWFVDVATIGRLISGRSLRFGVRQN